MEIKEAVEIFRTESQKLLYNSAERDFQAYSKAIYVISNALKDGYTLCKVDEAIEKMRNMNTSERKESVWDSGEITANTSIERCVNIIKEACK